MGGVRTPRPAPGGAGRGHAGAQRARAPTLRRGRRTGSGLTAGPLRPDDAATARRAVGLLFVANGMAMPALLPRLPQIKDAVGADAALFGLALLGTGVGGIVGSALAPRAVRRLGARRAAVAFAVALAGLTVLVGLAGSVPALFVAFALMGLSDGVADMTQNHLMFEVQRSVTGSLTSRMHALWSAGALVGAAAGTVAAGRGVSVVAQSVAFAALASLLAGRAAVLLAGTGIASVDPPAATVTRRSWRDRLAGVRWSPRWGRVVAAAVAVAAVEGIANEWSALTLRDGLGAGPALAGAGPTAFVGAMLAGRLVGDRAIDRVGVDGAARIGALSVVVGSGTGLLGAVVLDAPLVLVAGLVVAGIGAATLFPSMLAAGDRLDATGTGVAVASSASRLGFLLVPVLVGTLADATSLPVGFALMPLAAVAVVLILPTALRAPVPTR